MAKHTPVDVDPKQIDNAQQIWGNFMSATKFGIAATVIILLGLAAAFVDFTPLH